MSYCIIARDHPLHGPYHDREYGFPMEDDNDLFERLMLEIKAFAGFDSPASLASRRATGSA